MSDPLFDDVKELLDKEKGDERILKQILRACENNEVISNYERNYVQKLAEKHLGRKPPVENKPSIPKPIVPDVVLPSPPSQFQMVQKEPPQIKKSTKNSKMYVGIGGAALAVIIIAVITSTGLSGSTVTNIEKPSLNENIPGLSLETDSSSYQKKDIISISGKSDIVGTINLTIENQDGNLVWSEQLKTKSDGRFSTLVIAAGKGWEKSGIFTLKAENDSDILTKTFSFRV